MTSVYDPHHSLPSQLDEKDAQNFSHAMTTSPAPGAGLGLGATIGGGGEEEGDLQEGGIGDGAEERRGLLDATPRADNTDMKGKAGHAGVPQVSLPSGPKVNLRIMVISGQTYVFTFDPESSVGRIKEIIWHSWPQQWEKEPSRPPGPVYCRLLYLGRVLADDATLTSLNLRIAPAVTIIHLSIRTFELEAEEPPKKSILPFSLRPAPMTRSNSSQNATQLIPLSVTNAANGFAPGTGAGTAGEDASGRPSPGTRISSARGRARTSVLPANASAARNPPAAIDTTGRAGGTGQSATSRSAATYDAENDSHGGGCKCVIM